MSITQHEIRCCDRCGAAETIESTDVVARGKWGLFSTKRVDGTGVIPEPKPIVDFALQRGRVKGEKMDIIEHVEVRSADICPACHEALLAWWKA